MTFQRLGYTTLALGADAVPAVVSLAPKPTLLDAIAVSSVNANDLGEGSALTTSLLRRSTIATRGGSSLAERMEGIEGISLQRMGEWGSRALLRGLGGERVTVMVDGARVNRACTFGMDQGLSTVDPATVERVEVLSGPGSTLYGSGNIGGVINVVTKRPAVADGWHGEFRAAGATATLAPRSVRVWRYVAPDSTCRRRSTPPTTPTTARRSGASSAPGTATAPPR
ncbi:MAG: TonB-dependent receptor plug domain-containing protein [Gemmatimonadetes bacterium]|nr:TonB-dependent receptor plug domain-containing protein [Gemmatimonadota bacterium]